jgi:HD-like signal output (HDOD) protein
MKVACLSCGKSYNIPDEKLPMGKKVSFPCPNCREKIKLDLRPKEADLDNVTEELSAPEVLSPEKKKQSDELKERILKTLDDLPAMPQIVLKAREIMADPNSGVKDVVKILETDQAITTKILKVANSAYYGMSGKISTIQHASVVLGYKVIGGLITLASSSDLLDRVLDGYGFGSGDLWKHSLSVGIGSRILASRNNPELSETSFSVGLIHDAGKLVLDKYVQERKEEFEEIMEHGRLTFMAAEDKIFGFNHAEIGFDVCNRWSIPEEIATAINYHHTPSSSNNNELAYIVSMADAIVNMAEASAKMGGMGAEIEAWMYMLDDGTMEFLGLKEEDVKPIMDEIEKSFGEIIGEMA